MRATAGTSSRRAVSEIIAALLLVAIVVGAGILVYAFSSGTLGGLGGSFSGLISNQGQAVAESFVVEQASFTFPGAGSVAVDGTATNQVAGASTSIAAALTTSSSNDVVMAYVSAADTGSTSPPSVSGISGGGLTWNRRVASSAVTYASSHYLQLTITNNQASATPNPFQQSVTWDPSSYSAYEASDLGNVRFCLDASCGSPLYAWLESCTPSCSPSATLATAWVQLTSAIPGGGGSLTLYMVFQPTSTDFDGNYWGEAPNISGTYGQYDNGANVFTQYGGKSWGSFTEVGGTWDTNNGYLEQTSTGGSYNGGPAALIEGTSYQASGSYVLDTAFQYTTQATPRVGIVAVAGLSGGDAYGYRFIGQQSNNGAGFVSFLNDMRAWVVSGTYAGSTGTSYTEEVVDNAGSWSGTLFSGYGTSGTSLATLAATAYTANDNAGSNTGYVGVSAGWYNGGTVVANPAQFQWFLMRALPPNGVMPSVASGSLGSVATTFDLEEWYAVAPRPLSSVTVTATLSASDTAATWIAVFGVSGAETSSPFDPNPSIPASSSGATPSTTVSTSNANDVLLFGCAAGSGGVAPGFSGVFSSSYYPNQNEFVGYEAVTATQSGLATSCGADSYGAEVSDAIVAEPPGADLYVRNVGTVPVTIASVLVVDQSTGSFVSHTALSASVAAGSLVDVPHSTLAFDPSYGHTYSFTVTSSSGNSVVYVAEAV